MTRTDGPVPRTALVWAAFEDTVGAADGGLWSKRDNKMSSPEWLAVGREHGRHHLLAALKEIQEEARNPRKEAAGILLLHTYQCWTTVSLLMGPHLCTQTLEGNPCVLLWQFLEIPVHP